MWIEASLAIAAVHGVRVGFTLAIAAVHGVRVGFTLAIAAVHGVRSMVAATQSRLDASTLNRPITARSR